VAGPATMVLRIQAPKQHQQQQEMFRVITVVQQVMTK
jgi:hypothetical protein